MAGGSVVAAIIRRADSVLMVQQQGPDDPQPSWFVPGGRVEDGELLHEALAREVREETGLAITEPGFLAWVSQHDLDDPKWGGVWTAFVFEVPDPGGDPVSADPDGIVQKAEWVSLGEAIEHLRQVPHGPMREPAVAYLEGSAQPGHLWIWRPTPDHPHSPLHSLAAAAQLPANVAEE